MPALIPKMDEKLIAFFISTTYAAKNIAAKIGQRAHSGKIPKNQANRFPRLFIERVGKNQQADLDGTKGSYVEDLFDLEIISNTSSDILVLTDCLWDDIDCYFGLISTSYRVKGMFLEDQDDDYIPKGIGGDFGLDVAAFSLKVVYGST